MDVLFWLIYALLTFAYFMYLASKMREDKLWPSGTWAIVALFIVTVLLFKSHTLPLIALGGMVVGWLQSAKIKDWTIRNWGQF